VSSPYHLDSLDSKSDLQIRSQDIHLTHRVQRRIERREGFSACFLSMRKYDALIVVSVA
jgi:hypothetical protein